MNIRLVFGIVLTGIAVLLYGVGKPKLSKEKNYLDKAEVNEEQFVIFNGIIDSSNIPLEQFLVVASKEEFTGAGKHRGFKPVEQKLQPVTINKGTDTLLFEEAPYRGEMIAHILLDEVTSSNSPIQWQGIKQGTPLVGIGKRENKHINVMYSYAGAYSDYVELLTYGSRLLTQICFGLGIVGLPLLIWGFIKK
ncbi:hypothetical protein EI427_04305 [Flammeovirga pectinis]|uniref:Uncharacterized protein n=1 Tax=Flammeovirga pectinis TaxID=2494373 RepID=A0A3Q9FNV8_9BACT|nr:hypothetical protein [Flammeovirga pectinis]AZQ61475.1 hypothetical protein EI427_04305 [Flammeovirga pectinis]